MTGHVLRALEPRDLPRAKRMWFELLQCGEAADPRFKPAANAIEGIEAYARDVWVRQRPFPHGLVAEANGELIAFILGTPTHPVPVLERAQTAVITDIWVSPDWRGSGLGRELVAYFVKTVRAAGYPVVEVNTLWADERAVAFWRSLGFGDWMVRLSRED
jgi:GNAT superfamily N-acetyltransferase